MYEITGTPWLRSSRAPLPEEGGPGRPFLRLWRRDPLRTGRFLMSVLSLAAGAGHWIATDLFVSVMPDYLPAHRALVLVSGAAEMAGGVGLLLPRTRRLAAAGITVLLLAVFPANVWMAQHPERFPSVPGWILWARVPFQLPLRWWAWLYVRRDA